MQGFLSIISPILVEGLIPLCLVLLILFARLSGSASDGIITGPGVSTLWPEFRVGKPGLCPHDHPCWVHVAGLHLFQEVAFGFTVCSEDLHL